MKNIHVLPTDQPSRLVKIKDTFFLTTTDDIPGGTFYNIHITSDEEIRKNDYYIHNNRIGQSAAGEQEKGDYKNCKKIILTTDPILIADGVQSIDDEFLLWFVKNPTCEEVEVYEEWNEERIINGKDIGDYSYKIIIPQEEPKQEFLLFDKERANTITSEGQKTVRELQNTIQQETLEEAAEKYIETSYYMNLQPIDFIKFGANWQAERMYSEEDMIEFAVWMYLEVGQNLGKERTNKELFKEWFEQFKKK